MSLYRIIRFDHVNAGLNPGILVTGNSSWFLRPSFWEEVARRSIRLPEFQALRLGMGFIRTFTEFPNAAYIVDRKLYRRSPVSGVRSSPAQTTRVACRFGLASKQSQLKRCRDWNYSYVLQ